MLAAPWLLAPRVSVAQCEYDVTVIKPPPCPFFGPPPTFAYGVNELGDVAGSRWRCGNGWADDAAFVWTPESGIVLIDLPEGTFDSFSYDVNDAGQVVGTFDDADDSFSILAFLSDGDELTVIPPPAGTFSSAAAISNTGLIGGTTSDGTLYHKGFVWQDGAMELIVPTFGPRSLVHDVNEIGQVVGWMGTSVSIDAHAFVWDDGTVTDLGIVPGGSTGQATAINNLGHVVIAGRVQSKAGTVSRSFLWIDGDFTDLGILPGFDHTAAWDINDLGQVVGLCQQAMSPFNKTAFIWQNGVMTELNDLVADESISIYSADAINNAGQIVASGDENAESAALLLTPIRSCLGDLNCDGFVGIADFLDLLVVWGPHPGHPADLNGDGTVGIEDFLTLLASWGPCA